MSELTVRPTAKFIRAGVVLAVLGVLALEIACAVWWAVAPWVMAFPPVILLWPAMRALRRRFTRTVIAGDRLRSETGVLSRSTRTIQLSKIQDVRVDQGITQRLFDVGDLSIETAGEASRLSIHNVDSPHALADEIMDRVQKGAATA